jgi:fucokinase
MNTHSPASPLTSLAQGMSVLRLSVEAPERIAGWDAIVLTAASQHQAALYTQQLRAARRRGLIAERTRTLVVEDPGGRRIGSGGATLNALRRLRESRPDVDPASLKVLLIHAGGDSKRVPWANVLGKCFIPFPLFSDADRPALSVFDHQLAIAAPVAQAMRGGGLLTFSGDALPLFASARMTLPMDGALVVTSPVSLDIAERHGVILEGRRGAVADLLQKMPAAELARRGALVRGGAALLDTGIYVFTGAAFRGLARLAAAPTDPVLSLLDAGAESSLYEEVASAFVPKRHAWLRQRPLGCELVAAVGKARLVHHRADDLLFVHFGTSAEVLTHLGHSWQGCLARRVMAECGANAAAAAVICDSFVHPDSVVGRGSFVFGSRLGDGIRIGARSVVVGVDSGPFAGRFPDNICLWQAPIRAGGGRGASVLTACCGVDDNPKAALAEATFANRDLPAWMRSHGVAADDLWTPGADRTLWNARLFAPGGDGPRWALWLLGDGRVEAACRLAWRNARRLSLGEIQRVVSSSDFRRAHADIVDEVVLTTARRTIAGCHDRDVRALVGQLRGRDARRQTLALLKTLDDAEQRVSGVVPSSRRLRLRSDLLFAAGRKARSERATNAAFDAVQVEVTAAVKAIASEPVAGIVPGARACVRLPVRFDIAGGWSDTPPYCLERPACVLNMAMTLNGALPVGAEVEAIAERRWELVLGGRAGATLTVRNGERVLSEAGLADPFALLRTGLALSGYGERRRIFQGVRVRTWARVPRGSGLGTSSILAAALLSALQRLAGRPHDMETIIERVLVLEQRLTTGGGWQDQIGGLAPNIKLISSSPICPIRPRVEPTPVLPEVVRELESRLVIAFTGIERLAKNMLQIVVGRYLERDGRLLSAIASLADLAEAGRRCLALGDLDGLGAVMDEAWGVHQILDPHCSNPDVDALFRHVAEWSSGGKLAGAGGGGFMGILARDAASARRMRACLNRCGGGVRVYDWQLYPGLSNA